MPWVDRHSDRSKRRRPANGVAAKYDEDDKKRSEPEAVKPAVRSKGRPTKR
jgi:hypothetical protein